MDRTRDHAFSDVACDEFDAGYRVGSNAKPGPDARKQIVQIHLKKRDRDPELFDVNEIAAACEGYSGAEIEAGIKASIYAAFNKNSLLSTRMVVEPLKASPPLSVTMAEKIAELREWASGRCVAAE